MASNETHCVTTRNSTPSLRLRERTEAPPTPNDRAQARRARLRKPPPRVVPALDPLEHRHPGFGLAAEPTPWLGLVPRQYSTGGKTRLGHITKRGDPYLRTLLVMGARSVLQRGARDRPLVPMGATCSGKTRLSPRLHRRRRQERTRRLGSGCQGGRGCLAPRIRLY
jgi:hypothetical protein